MASVYEFLKEELGSTLENRSCNCDISHLLNVEQRTAEATGVSLDTVRRVLKLKEKIKKPKIVTKSDRSQTKFVKNTKTESIDNSIKIAETKICPQVELFKTDDIKTEHLPIIEHSEIIQINSDNGDFNSDNIKIEPKTKKRCNDENFDTVSDKKDFIRIKNTEIVNDNEDFNTDNIKTEPLTINEESIKKESVEYIINNI